ncbi:hypothetical protein HYR99_29010 [Candidatus Poribacteria bacterium]|nr:hypothetical protein [Candidatus Poribacteria bacterium]
MSINDSSDITDHPARHAIVRICLELKVAENLDHDAIWRRDFYPCDGIWIPGLLQRSIGKFNELTPLESPTRRNPSGSVEKGSLW